MKIKIYKVSLEYSSGRQASPIFVNAHSLENATINAQRKYGKKYTIKEIAEDLRSAEPRIFNVIYYHAESLVSKEHHKGVVSAHSELDAWKAANVICLGNQFWVQHINETKINTLDEATV